MKYNFFFFIFLVCISFSCEKEDESAFSQRTVLVYMVADNNLYKNAQTDINEMLEVQGKCNGNLIVYLDAPSWSSNPKPQLFKIQQGKTIPVKQYESLNSAAGATLRNVINDVVTLFPAKNYGLILWSHGTGWLPEGAFENLPQETNALRSFAKKGAHEMNIEDLAEALPFPFEFIIFDACLMSQIEVLYQLKDKSDVIVASPTEILAHGFPYNAIVPFLFTSKPDYISIAKSYMDYYKNQSADLQSASIAVVKTEQLRTFANFIRKIIEEKEIIPPNKNIIQRYEARSTPVFYDLQDYLTHAIQKKEYIQVIEDYLSKIIMYHDNTPCFLNQFSIKNSCGVSLYVSFSDDILDGKYKQLSWYTDSKLIGH
jgi:hypothetical protein